MRFKQVGNKNDVAMIVIKNNHATKTIPLGAPVFFQFNGTDDGVAIVDANTAAAAAQTCRAGVNIQSGGLAPSNYGEAQVYGFCQTTRLVRQTRATTTDAYASAAAVSVGDILSINTLTNLDAFSDAGAGSTGTILPFAIAAQTLSALVSQASNGYTGASSSQTAVTTTIKSFLTML